jgi:predicted amidohydrolase
MSDTVRAAVVQMDVAIGDVEGNLARVLERLDDAAASGAKLVVLPECALTGYCFEALTDARPYAKATADALATFAGRCAEREVTGLVGTLTDVGGAVYNTAALAGPDGDLRLYHKTHLPTLGIDRFVSAGDALRVFDAAGTQLGVLVCYDLRFPEAARCLTVMGAEVIAVPTNWPDGADSAPDYVTRARARENVVYVLAANRIGTEEGTHFIGRSQIVAPSGEVLAQAGDADEITLYADLDLRLARDKRVVIRPGEWEMDVVGDRRPELYGPLIGDPEPEAEDVEA